MPEDIVPGRGRAGVGNPGTVASQPQTNAGAWTAENCQGLLLELHQIAIRLPITEAQAGNHASWYLALPSGYRKMHGKCMALQNLVVPSCHAMHQPFKASAHAADPCIDEAQAPGPLPMLMTG